MKNVMLFAAATLVSGFVMASNLDITEVWARPTIGEGDHKTSAVYMKIKNNGKEDALIGAHTDVASVVEMHQTVMEKEAAKMVKLAKVVIPALNTVSFEPAGLHVMLSKVTKDLKEGDKFSLELNFQTEGKRVVEVTVKPYNH